MKMEYATPKVPKDILYVLLDSAIKPHTYFKGASIKPTLIVFSGCTLKSTLLIFSGQTIIKHFMSVVGFCPYFIYQWICSKLTLHVQTSSCLTVIICTCQTDCFPYQCLSFMHDFDYSYMCTANAQVLCTLQAKNHCLCVCLLCFWIFFFFSFSFSLLHTSYLALSYTPTLAVLFFDMLYHVSKLPTLIDKYS